MATPSLVKAFADQWRRTQADLDDLRREVSRASLQTRAEVAASTPVFADVASLPTGALGMIATVADDGGSPALYWHDGSLWVKVAP